MTRDEKRALKFFTKWTKGAFGNRWPRALPEVLENGLEGVLCAGAAPVRCSSIAIGYAHAAVPGVEPLAVCEWHGGLARAAGAKLSGLVTVHDPGARIGRFVKLWFEPEPLCD